MDTRSKRASSVALVLSFVLAPPLPDSTLDQGDRQHIAWSYSGILAQVDAGEKCASATIAIAGELASATIANASEVASATIVEAGELASATISEDCS